VKVRKNNQKSKGEKRERNNKVKQTNKPNPFPLPKINEDNLFPTLLEKSTKHLGKKIHLNCKYHIS